MNKVFKKIWSQKHGVFVAVAETASAQGKASTGVVATVASKGLGVALVVGLSLAHVDSALAVTGNTLPTGGQVVAGSAAISTSANTLTVNQSTQRAAINWQSFSIGSGGTVNFVQPNASSVTLNRVVGNEQSVIAGALNANGQVFLLNSSGVLFTGTSSVNVGGIVASTLNQSDADFMAGRSTFERNGTAGSVINLGSITTADGGYVAMLGNQVKNEGVITARLGTAILAAGDKVSLNFNGNSLVGVTIDQGTLNALVENQQAIRADGGLVILTAKGLDSVMHTVVNNTGEVRAQTIQNKDGKIYLLGGMESDRIEVGGTLDASAPNGGNGGFIETSAANVRLVDGRRVTTHATNGRTGTWLIDPNDYTIAASGGDITGTQLGTDLGSNNVTIATASQGTAGGNGDIHVNDAVTWSSGNTLTLTAERNININENITASNAGKLVLEYGQGAVAANNTATYNIASGKKINLDAGGNFDTKLGSDGTAINWNVITQLGIQGDESNVLALSLQGLAYSSRLSGNFVLGADIDGSATSTWNGNQGFVPIGNGSSPGATNFSGRFDGLGHTISNLKIYNGGSAHAALFGHAALGSTFSNLILSNVAVTNTDTSSSARAGALIGVSYGSAISGIRVVGGTVTAKTNSGGLIGEGTRMTVTGVGSITNSSSTASVTVDSTGLGSSRQVGGLAGTLSYWTVSNSYADSTISYTPGSATSSDRIGGFLGRSLGTSFTNSYALGSINSAITSGEVGGFVGNGNGGAFGSTATLLTNVYSATSINAASAPFKGGLVGNAINVTASNSFWDTTVTGQSLACGTGATCSSGALTGATGKTTAEMKTLTTFDATNSANWSIVSDASLNNVYPQLRWATSGLSAGSSVWVMGPGSGGGGSGGGGGGGGSSGNSGSSTTTDVITPVANALITPPAFEPPVFVAGLPPQSGSATTPPPNVVNPPPAVTAALGSNVPLMLVSAPNAGQPTQGVTLSQAMAMLGGGGAEGAKVVRVPTSRNSMEDIVNGGLRLPDGVEQELFVVQASVADQ